jgi:hypothetical protein
MRVELTSNTYDIETMPGSFEEETTISMNFRGRTDNAQIPPHLLDKMKLLFDKDTLIEYFFKDKEPCSITLFGEGYGAKIQKGGNYIKDDVNFILFDVLVNGKWWLKRSALEQIAKDLNNAGFETSAIKADLSSRESILALIKHSLSFGNITNLINAAGVSPSQAPIEAVLKVDLYGTAVLMEEFGKVISEGGSAIMISSNSCFVIV